MRNVSESFYSRYKIIFPSALLCVVNCLAWLRYCLQWQTIAISIWKLQCASLTRRHRRRCRCGRETERNDMLSSDFTQIVSPTLSMHSLGVFWGEGEREKRQWQHISEFDLFYPPPYVSCNIQDLIKAVKHFFIFSGVAACYLHSLIVSHEIWFLISLQAHER